MMRDAARAWSLIVAIGVLLTVATCGKKPVVTPPPAPPPVPAPVVQTPPPPPPPQTQRQVVQPPPPVVDTAEMVYSKTSLDELNRSGALADVFFELDEALLSDSARATLQKNAEWLNVAYRRSARVSVEGHADSRGTNEYNLALGERRAASVRDYLVSLGVAADRVSIVSKGEEDPACTEEAETCWSRNRRGHFIITAK